MITSSSNELIKHIKKLQTKKSYRRECGQYVLEGLRQVRDGITHVKTLIVSESFDISLLPEADGVQMVSDKLFAQLSETKSPQGIMAVASMKNASLDEVSQGENPFVVFCDSVSDPGNLGTIIRTCDAAGVSGIILNSTCADLYNPKTVRSAMASIFNVKIHICEDSIYTLNSLKEKGIKIFAAGPMLSEEIYDCDFKSPSVVVVGNEANGISDELLTTCDKYVKIPMLGKAESLNVSVAAALIVYEGVRQRRV